MTVCFRQRLAGLLMLTVSLGVGSRTVYAADVRVFAFGDWGASTGETQFDRALGRQHQKEPVDAVLLLGDNFYDGGGTDLSDGVNGPDDPQFFHKFERRLASKIKRRFYAVLGNHDYSYDRFDVDESPDPYGNYLAEVEYTYYSNIKQRSGLWYMPSRYYDFTIGKIHFFALDTSPGHNIAMDRFPQWPKDLVALKNRAHQYSPKNLAWLELELANQKLNHQAYMKKQLAWLAHAMKASRAEWKVVLGHHPLQSDSEGRKVLNYGKAEVKDSAEQKSFEAILDKHADLYLSGHDHSLQWHEVNLVTGVGANDANERPLMQAISGAADQGYPGRPSPMSSWFTEDPGFVELWLDDEDDELFVNFYKVDGKGGQEGAVLIRSFLVPARREKSRCSLKSLFSSCF